MDKYNHQKIEKKWQRYWEKKKVFEAKEDPKKKKFYALIEFPYPSGAGLHVGHPRSYTAMDILARKKRMEGYNVLYPIGFDSFGLPTENYAIKTGRPPAEITKENIANFTRQLKMLGFSFDWSRAVVTSEPEYYRWTQWIFLQFFKHGLAYKKSMPINWCLSCKIGLANEEVVNGVCERCGGPIEKRDKEQWMLAITKYADKLLAGLKEVDYIPEIKIQQENWIGRSEGAMVQFRLSPPYEGGDKGVVLEVFTTRPDTLFGATYLVISPEHSLISNIKYSILNIGEVKKYIEKARRKSDLERTELQKEKTGVELKGIKAVNPVNGEELPIFVADYVLMGYGTGAIMGVPAHDERDWEFAEKYGLPIREVVVKKFGDVKPNSIRHDGVAAVLLNKKGQIFVLKNKDGEYELPAGRYNEGENDEKTLRREIIEETGFTDFEIGDFLGTIQVNFYIKEKNIQRLKYQKGYVVNLKSDTQQQPQLEEFEDFVGEWRDLKDALLLFEKYNVKGQTEFVRRALDVKERCFAGDGAAINSVFLDNLETSQAKEKMISWLEEKKAGKRQVQYKLRDWVFSRQRYWGEPIPLVKCEKCGWVPLPEKDLPLKLPKVKRYQPTDTGESPLSALKDWVNTTCPKCGQPAKRETDTMPNWAGSSWYFLRYCDPHNNKTFAAPEKLKYWMPVDWYNGGMEHVVLHLLYSRFWNQFLSDIGAVPASEPYRKRTTHGMILAEDGEKMSKSRGNVINPDEMVQQFGADAFRTYIMFMGPFDQACAWSTKGVVGVRRFLERVWQLQEKLQITNYKFQIKSKIQNPKSKIDALDRLVHKTIKKVTEDIENFKFNTAVSALMILANEMSQTELISNIPASSCLAGRRAAGRQYSIFLKLLSPFAPHLCEELWSRLGHKNSIAKEPWPSYDPSLAKDEIITLAIQVNGKLRDTLEVGAEISEDEVKEKVLASPKVQKWLAGKEIKRFIYLPGKLVNLVIA